MHIETVVLLVIFPRLCSTPDEQHITLGYDIISRNFHIRQTETLFGRWQSIKAAVAIAGNFKGRVWKRVGLFLWRWGERRFCLITKVLWLKLYEAKAEVEDDVSRKTAFRLKLFRITKKDDTKNCDQAQVRLSVRNKG